MRYVSLPRLIPSSQFWLWHQSSSPWRALSPACIYMYACMYALFACHDIALNREIAKPSTQPRWKMTDDKLQTHKGPVKWFRLHGGARVHRSLPAFYKRTSFARKRTCILACAVYNWRTPDIISNIDQRRWWHGNRLKSEVDSYGRTARNSRYINDRLDRDEE